MTIQVPDWLELPDRRVPVEPGLLNSCPVKRFWKAPFLFRSTTCWRNYVATFQIVGRKLYLKDLDAYVAANPVARAFPRLANVFRRSPEVLRVELADLFGKSAVFMSWYSGVLKIPYGKPVPHHHAGLRPLFDRYVRIFVEDGYVRRAWSERPVNVSMIDKYFPLESREHRHAPDVRLRNYTFNIYDQTSHSRNWL